MGKVKYKKPSNIINRMIIKSERDDRPSLGMTEIKGEIYYLDPNLIISYKNQARKNISEDSLAGLALSIENQGIIQPLQLISSIEDPGKFEVISGERRLQAALKIGLDRIPCMILDKERDANEIALIENIQRENLHPIELADAISNLIEERSYSSQTALAEKIGVSKQKVTHLMAISRLPEDIKQHFLLNKKVTITFIKTISYLGDEEEMRKRVFKKDLKEDKFRSILRISSNGSSFRYDQFKIDSLTKIEKELLKVEISNILNKIEA